MKAVKSVGACPLCRSLFETLQLLYGMCWGCPDDLGLFEETLRVYVQHYKEVHSVHSDRVGEHA